MIFFIQNCKLIVAKTKPKEFGLALAELLMTSLNRTHPQRNITPLSVVALLQTATRALSNNRIDKFSFEDSYCKM